MVVTREFINGCNRYTLDGEKVTRNELEARCGKYLSGYGLRSMFRRLEEYNPTKLIIDVDGADVYAGLREMYAEDALARAKLKIAQLEEKLATIKNTCNA